MSENGGWEVDLATKWTAWSLMASTDTAAKVRCCRSYRLTFTASLLIDWLIGLPSHRARHVWRLWPSVWTQPGVWRTRGQPSSVNTLAGLSNTHLLSSVFASTWQLERHLVHFPFVLRVNSTIVNVSIKSAELRKASATSLSDGVTPQSLCSNYAVSPALGPVWPWLFPGSELRECLQGVGLATEFNSFNHKLVSCEPADLTQYPQLSQVPGLPWFPRLHISASYTNVAEDLE